MIISKMQSSEESVERTELGKIAESRPRPFCYLLEPFCEEAFFFFLPSRKLPKKDGFE
jgi:hypothetical protein